MKRLYLILLALAGMATLFSPACRKKYEPQSTVVPSTVNPFGPPPSGATTGSELNKLFKALRYTPEVKCVTAGIPQTVTFSKGTKLTFYANSFKDKNGNIITSGTVCISMIEMYKPGDMIANRASTTSGSDQLRSGGQVYIEATKDGQKVYANKYGIGFRQAAPSTQAMALYYGGTNNSDSLVLWGKGSTALGTIVAGTVTDTVADTSTGGGGGGSVWTYPFYQFDSCIDFNWINCDYQWPSAGAKASATVAISDTGFSNYNTQVFMVFTSINSVTRVYQKTTSPLTFESAQHPIGEDIILVVMAVKYGTYYYYEEATTLTPGLTIHAALAPHTLEYVQDKLHNF